MATKKTAARKTAKKEAKKEAAKPAVKPAAKAKSSPKASAKPAAKAAPAAKSPAKSGKSAKSAVPDAKKTPATRKKKTAARKAPPADDEDEEEGAGNGVKPVVEDEDDEDIDIKDIELTEEDVEEIAEIALTDEDIPELETVDVEDADEDEEKKDKLGVRKPAGKKPKIITITNPAARKTLRLAPGVMISGAKPAAPACNCGGHGDNKDFRKLNKKEAAHIKDKLIEMREAILEGMRKELADARQRSSSAPADIIDQAADAYDDDVSFEIAAANDEELEQIEAALERLSEGTYGLCEMCNAPISPTRLRILPFATRCVSCRGDYEKSRQRRDSGGWNFFGETSYDDDSEE